ncbi:MAG: hypothetical protein ACPGSI_17300 [Pikeienuella sp.]
MKMFRDALIVRLEETGIPLSQVAEGAGVSYEQLKKLKQVPDRSTNVEDAIRVADFFGMSVEEFMSDGEVSGRHELAAILTRLSPEARKVLTTAAKAQLASEDLPLAK